MKWLGRRIAGISKDEWYQVVDAVVEAQQIEDASGEEKKSFVMETLKAIKVIASAWAVNIAVELAVGYAKKKGLI